jgi:hypothetical protein
MDSTPHKCGVGKNFLAAYSRKISRINVVFPHPGGPVIKICDGVLN